MRRCAVSVVGLVALVLGLLAAMAGSALAASGWTAYVADSGSSVTPIDTATNTAGAAITVGTNPLAVAITPDGETAYVPDKGSGSVTPIETATNTAGTAINVGTGPQGIAITPDGKTVYVANSSDNTVTPIDTATNTAGTPIPVGTNPFAVAITPNGKTAYVTNFGTTTVTPIDTATNTAGPAIPVGAHPEGIAIAPDGKTAYVANHSSATVTPIDTATNTAGPAIPVGTGPYGVAVTPDGKTAYVTNNGGGTVTPIDTATNTAGAAIAVGTGPTPFPTGVAVTPDGKTAYVAVSGNNTVIPISTATNTVGTAIPIPAGSELGGISITPDQAPTAAFSVVTAPASQSSSFDGSASSSPVGSIAIYSWDFGDGHSVTTTNPVTTHIYASPGTYTARLTVTNSGGTSTTQVFTGQTVSRQGGPQAAATRTVTVAPRIAPALSGLRVFPRGLSIAGRKVSGKCVKPTKKNNPSKHCRRAIKLKISYMLNVADTVTITIKRKAPARKVNGRCVKPTTTNSKHRNCSRLISVHGRIAQSGKAGANRFTWNGEIGGHQLSPGTYQLTATPTGGKSHTVTFTILG